MTTTTKITKTNANAISRLLTAKGFRRSVSATTIVRGYHIDSDGFIAINCGIGVIVKWHYTRHSPFFNELDRISEFLISKGYEVNVRGTYTLKLFVTKEGN